MKSILKTPTGYGLCLATFLLLLALSHIALDKKSTIGFIWLILAAILLIRIAPPLSSNFFRGESERPESLVAQIRHGWRGMAGGGGLFFSGVLLLIAYMGFFRLTAGDIPSRSLWLYFWGGLFLLVVGGHLVTFPQQTPGYPRWQWPALLLVVLLALFFRVYLFDMYPRGLWYDEALNGLEARRIMNEPDYQPVFTFNMTFPHLLVYGVMLEIFGETSIQALRFSSVLPGIASVLAAYFVGRELRGVNFGLGMAFFMAIMRWHVNFSRIAMNGVEVVFFTLLAFYFLLRLSRYYRIRDALWAGLAAGIGLWFYSAFRLIVPVLGLYLLIKFRFWQVRMLLLPLLVAVVSLLVILPLIRFAQVNEDVFFQRTRQVSIFEETKHIELTVEDAFQQNVEAHLKMFHLQGDKNARHNIPLEPMLDPLMGLLLVPGTGIALRSRRPEAVFFVLVMAVAIVGSSLTLTFEAPHGLRTIGAISAIVYFCALALLAFIQAVDYWLTELMSVKHWPALLVTGGITAAVLLGSTIQNYHDYFVRHQAHYGAWVDFQAEELLWVQLALEDYPQSDIFISENVSLIEGTAFIAPNMPVSIYSAGGVVFAHNSFRPVTLFFHPEDQPVLDYLYTLFPDATTRVVYLYNYGIDFEENRLLYHIVTLDASDLRQLAWPAEATSGSLYAPVYGEYHLRVHSDNPIKLGRYELTMGEHQLYLAQGFHRLQLNAPSDRIEWILPGDAFTRYTSIPDRYLYHEKMSTGGLLGCFYDNLEWQGNVVQQWLDSTLNLNLHQWRLRYPYSAIWYGQLEVPFSGYYELHLKARESAELWLNGEQIMFIRPTIDNYQKRLGIQLAAGRYDIAIRYRGMVDTPGIRLTWQLPAESEHSLIPPEYLISPVSPDSSFEEMPPEDYCTVLYQRN